MQSFYKLRLRLRSLFQHHEVDSELTEELRFHLQKLIDEGVTHGMTPEEARYAALRELGGVEQIKEECREMRRVNYIENFVQDIRYGLRQLGRNSGFTVVAVLVLAMGISGAVAIFGFADAALIRPLPYRDPSRLVEVFESSPGNARGAVSYLNFADWKRLNRAFSSIDAFALNGGFTLTTANGAEPVRGTRVSAGFFRTLGAVPSLGRDFRTGEDSTGAAPTVILSYAAWQKRFGGRKDVLGQAITLGGAPTTIIGVLPRGFPFAPYGGAEFWTTLRASDGCEQNRACHNLETVARLKDGFSVERATSDVRLIVRQLQTQYPDSNRYVGSAILVPLRDIIIGDVRPILFVLLSGAGL